jgi:ubiquinone/menaquinone biosynthesis C-methylase UbiE
MKATTDPEGFDKVSKLAFAPIYPYLARCITNKFGISKGVCVDVGSGPGSLAIAIARITKLQVYSLDIQERMTEVALRNIAQAGLSSRIRAVTADVCKMPFDDESIDIVVSRGSMPFWEDRRRAFREIYRVLKPSGIAYVGGGFGSEEIKSQVFEAFSKNDALKDSREKFLVGMRRAKFEPEQIQKELDDSDVQGTVENEFCGRWVQIIKPEARPTDVIDDELNIQYRRQTR